MTAHRDRLLDIFDGPPRPCGDRVMKLYLPAEIQLLLHRTAILEERRISEIVRTALDRYFARLPGTEGPSR
ncbi:MAG: hypothetical protein ACT4PT_05935 [Methanobacteriota archaeon]